MANRDLKIRIKDYALSVIRLFAALPKRTETQVLGRQLLTAGHNLFEAGSYLDGTTTGHEHDHGGFPEHETQERLVAFFPLST